MDSPVVFALAYQVPALVLGVLMRLLIRRPVFQAVFLWPGTLVHEALHLAVGTVLNGRPVSISLWPRRVGPAQWILGSVGFVNLRWYNAVFIGMAPLLAIGVVVLLTPPLPAPGWAPQQADFLRWLLGAPVLATCLPSSTDLKLAMKSWPLFCGVAALVALRYYF
jgi:hypothetical protein